VRGAVAALALLARAASAQPQCYGGTLTGVSGSTSTSLSLSSGYDISGQLNGVLFGAGVNGGSPRYNRVYKVDLGADTLLGGTLTLTTCSNTTNFDTTLALGYTTDASEACATQYSTWTWVDANDNAQAGTCTYNWRASMLARAGADRRVWYVAVGAYSASGTGTYELLYAYALPSQTPSAAPTPVTATPTPTPSSSPSLVPGLGSATAFGATCQTFTTSGPRARCAPRCLTTTP
jgi:hypothetical protein